MMALLGWLVMGALTVLMIGVGLLVLGLTIDLVQARRARRANAVEMDAPLWEWSEREQR